MKFWWKNTKRVAAEKLGIESLAANESWLTIECWKFLGGNLTVSGVITANEAQFPIRLIYPDQFPEVPAWVESLENTIWTQHQYGKVLCLDRRPDNWVPTTTGEDLLRSTHHLLETERPKSEGGAPTPSAHNVGQIQRYGLAAHPVLIDAGCANRIKSGAAKNLVALRCGIEGGIYPILIHDEIYRDSPRRPVTGKLSPGMSEVSVVVSNEKAPSGALDRDSVIASAKLGLGILLVDTTNPFVLLFAGGDDIAAFHIFDVDNVFQRNVHIIAEDQNIRSGRAPGTHCKRVAIIGVGSIGSKIADSLVRSGIHRLVIVDGDVFLPSNIERHVLDWRDIGLRKVSALQRHLLEISPGAEISTVESNLNWQRSAKTHATDIDKIANCDVIVDATGDTATSLFLGAIAAANDRPYVSTAVYEGGIGALVSTSLPHRDPPYAFGRSKFLAWCKEQNAELPRTSVAPYESLASNGEVIVADDAAAGIAACHATRTILDILEGSSASQDSAWMLLGFRQGWVFKGHGHNILLSVGNALEQTNCEQDAEAAQWLVTLLKDLADANPNS